MTTQTLVDAVLIVVIIGWLGFRQTTWRPVALGQMWRGPIILTVIGLVILAQTSGVRLTTVDLAAIIIEVIIALGIGAAMGAIAHFRRLPAPVAVGRRDRGEHADYESRTSGWGLTLWFVMIASRVGIDVGAHLLGGQLVTSAGVILLVFGANLAARTAVFGGRLHRHAALTV